MGSDIARILIADSHALMRRAIRAAIPAPVICEEALTAGEALEKAVSFAPDVVLLDTSLPGLGGLELTRGLRRLVPDATILVLSMYESTELATQYRDAGAHGYLVKVDAGRALGDALAALRAGHTYFRHHMQITTLDAGEASERAPSERRRLTQREAEVLKLLAEGRSNKEVAATLEISVNTVETHRARIMNKLSLHSMNELVRYAIRNRLIDL